MKGFGLRSRRLLIACTALFAVAGGIAYAAIPDAGSGTYHACMLKGVGTIRILDPERQHCSAALETEITFNQKGVKGDPGEQGRDGVSPTVAQLVAGDTHCPAGGAAITDAGGNTAYVCGGRNGADGHDGQSFSGSFASPNGLYSISVTDSGVTLAAGGASIKLTGSDIEVKTLGLMNVQTGTEFQVLSGGQVSIVSSAAAQLIAAARLTLRGSVVDVN